MPLPSRLRGGKSWFWGWHRDVALGDTARTCGKGHLSLWEQERVMENSMQKGKW